MKIKVAVLLIACALQTAFVLPLNAVSYEASTLHNAVSRSETVLDLFFARWRHIQEKELYFDLFGRINWVPNFKINTVNTGSGEKESVPMTLVRTYGSVTLNFPIIGGYEGAGLSDRLSGKRKRETEEESKGTGPLGLWKPRNLILGVTATGFHYGLTRKTTVNRGSAGTESVTDYKYSQFFDDIFALSVLYLPYFYLHGGVIINNQIEPNDDGTMDYSNSANRTVRYFFASNLLSFLNLNAATTSEKLESIAVDVRVTRLLEMALGTLPLTVPQVTITYKMINLYNDEPYDAVWVRSAIAKDSSPKSSILSDSLKEDARLHTLGLLVEENLFYYVYIKFNVEFQEPSETLFDKRTNRKLVFDPLREAYVSVAYNFLGKKAADGYLFTVTVGASRFWDPAIPVHRREGSKFYLYGGFGALTFTTPFGGAELKAVYNYAPEIRKLVETADKAALEGSVFFNL